MDADTKKEFETLNKKTSILTEETKLSALDTTVLSITFFLIALYISLISSGIINVLKDKPGVLVGFVYFGLPIFMAIVLMWRYIDSIIYTNERFDNKITYLTFIFGSVTFVLFAWILLFIFNAVESRYPEFITPKIVNISLSVIVIITVIITMYNKKKIKEYFHNNYPTLIQNSVSSSDKQEVILSTAQPDNVSLHEYNKDVPQNTDFLRFILIVVFLVGVTLLYIRWYDSLNPNFYVLAGFLVVILIILMFHKNILSIELSKSGFKFNMFKKNSIERKIREKKDIVLAKEYNLTIGKVK